MKQKMLSLLLALAMVCSMVMPAFAAEETAQYTIPEDVKGKLVVLHTNDTHGSDEALVGTSIGTAGVAQLKKDFEAAGAEVILMSAGDAIMGGPLVSISKGEAAIEFMNTAKYDVMTIGNHEMDFGYDNLKELIKLADFPVLGANVLDAKTKKPVMEENSIFTTESGLKVGVFGLATPETLTKADANKMKDITFSAKPEDLYATAKAQVEALKKAGAEFIVCLGHLGVDEGSAGLRSVDVCNSVEGIDLFVDGHSHTVMENGTPKDIAVLPTFENKSDTLIVSTGTGLTNVGVVIYDKETKTMTSDLISNKEYSKTDATLVEMIKAVSDNNKVKYGDKIATTEIDLNGSRSGGAGDAATNGTKVDFPANVGNRTAETNLGDFAADAILWQARKVMGADKVDASLTNGGGIRKTIAKGDVSKLDLLTVFPFGNTVVTIDVTGEQLLEALEAAAATLPTATGSFAQVSGITYIVTPAVPFKSTETYSLSTFAKPAELGSRVTIATVGDKAFDLKATYTIATNDFTAGGGDSYRVFKGIPMNYTGKTLDEALISYTTEELKGVITAEQYGQPQGRIAIMPMDVAPEAWYAEAVYFNVLLGTMNGTDKGFEPAATLTRAQVCQTLYNMAGRPTEGVNKAAFNDIEGKWYSDAAHWASFVGLVEGKADGSFGGDDAITRAETAQVIANYAQVSDITVNTAGMAMKEAPDYDKIPADYLEGMTYCYYADVMVGDQNGNLNPDGILTRAQMAQIIYNFEQIPAASWDELVQADWTEQSVALDTGINMTYLTCGPEDGTPVLLIHGATDSRLSWAQVAPTLAETYGYRCYIPELRGHGKTDKPTAGTEGYTVVQHSKDILNLMDKIDLESAVVVGHSLGSLIAQELAITAPKRVQKVALIASAAQTVENAALKEVLQGNGVDYLGVKGYEKEGAMPADYVAAWAGCSNEDPNFVKAIYEHAKALPYQSWYNIFAGCNAVDNRSRLSTITCPVDIIWGSADSIFLSGDQKQLQQGLTKATVNFFPIEGASHNTHWDSKAVMETVCKELDRFIKAK